MTRRKSLSSITRPNGPYSYISPYNCLVVAEILNVRPIHSWNCPAKFREIVKYWEDDTRSDDSRASWSKCISLIKFRIFFCRDVYGKKRGRGLEIYALKNIFDWPRQTNYNIDITLVSSKLKRKKQIFSGVEKNIKEKTRLENCSNILWQKNGKILVTICREKKNKIVVSSRLFKIYYHLKSIQTMVGPFSTVFIDKPWANMHDTVCNVVR